MTADTGFCLDTSFLINGWRKHYSIAVFPSLWTKLDSLIDEEVILSCDEVYEELKRQRDDLFDWATARRNVFKKPNKAVLAECKRIMSSHKNIAAAGGSTNRADPWVIAQAIVSGTVVVTDESPAPNQRATKPPRIPDVCDALGVPWSTPVEFLAKARIVI